MQWLSDLIHPSAKCNRIGHKAKEHRRETIRWPGEEYRSVADSCRETMSRCSRCRKVLVDWTVIERSGINSLSMPSDDWDKLKDDGVLVS